MNQHFLSSLDSLWKTAEMVYGKDSNGKAIADSIAWLIPEARVCAVYSRPMDVLEMFAVRIGGAVVGAAGAWRERDYPEMVRKQGLVMAPCLLRPYLANLDKVSPLLTEAVSRTPEYQELVLAA